MDVITTIVYLSMTNMFFFIFFKLTNGAKVISTFTNIESIYFLLFSITTFSLIFKNKAFLIRFLQHFILCYYFFETVRHKNYVNILSIIAIFTVGVPLSLSLLVYQHFC